MEVTSAPAMLVRDDPVGTGSAIKTCRATRHAA